MRTSHIRALTGVRFFAAIWVVGYHISRHNADLLERHFPNLDDLTRPLLSQGTMGVDLFFVLSGFVLALNYLDRLGPRLDPAIALRFIWLRLARVWPLYMTVLVSAGALISLRHHLWGSVGTGKLTGRSFLQQTLMIQEWVGTYSWSGPAWSLSAEWLAYLLCPLLALVVLRLRDTLGFGGLVLGAALAVLPCVVVASADGTFIGPGDWAVRVLGEFSAGMMLYAALSRLEPTDRVRALAGWTGVVVLAGLVTFFYLTFRTDLAWAALPVGVAAFPVLIGTLAIGTGPLVWLLSSPSAVLGGRISYAVYLVHSPLLYLWRDLLVEQFDVPAQPVRLYLEVAAVPVILALAWLLFRFVEEPARLGMRRMLDR